MEEGNSTKNVSPIRTFAQDAARLRSTRQSKEAVILPEKTDTEESAEKAAETTQETPKQSLKGSAPEVRQANRPLKNSYLSLTEEANQIGDPQKESLLSDSNDSFDVSGKAGGTIIRDTKRKRFRLFPAMAQATTEWFVGQKTSYDNKKHPQHTIESADARKEVIEAAVQKSALAPKEDFATVAERLKGVQRKPVTSTITFKEKSEVPKPQWSYVEQDAKETQTAPSGSEDADVTLNTPVQKAAASAATEVAPVDTEALLPAETNTENVPHVRVNPFAQTAMPHESALENAAFIATKEKASEETAPVEEPQTTGKVEQTTPTVPYMPAATSEPLRFSRSLLVSVILGAIFLGVGVSYFLFTQKDAPQEKAIVYKIPSLLQASSQIAFALPSSRTELLNSISGLLEQNGSVIQLYPTIAEESAVSKPASAEQILSVLSPRAPGSFQRGVMEITFGGVGTEPFIVMKVSSFDAAFAGMLEWERAMSADLSPLYGVPVVETFDPSARTDTQVRDAFFKDAIASNKNIRLLLDEEGEDRIVYTFTNQNTLVITTTREALETLVPLLK